MGLSEQDEWGLVSKTSGAWRAGQVGLREQDKWGLVSRTSGA